MRVRLYGFVIWVLLTPLGLLSLIALPFLILAGPAKWARRALRGYDNWVNATAFRGSPYETVSSHAWRARHTRWGALLVALLDIVDERGHCMSAHRDEARILEITGERDG